MKSILPSAVDDVLSFLLPPLDLLQGVGKDAVGVLRMIKRRLQAEMKTIGRNDLKMLSKLLQEDDLEVCPTFQSDEICLVYCDCYYGGMDTMIKSSVNLSTPVILSITLFRMKESCFPISRLIYSSHSYICNHT